MLLWDPLLLFIVHGGLTSSEITVRRQVDSPPLLSLPSKKRKTREKSKKLDKEYMMDA